MAKVAAVHIGYLLDYASMLGMDAESLRTSLDPEHGFGQTTGRVDAEHYLDLFHHLCMESGDAHFGLNFGNTLNVRTLGFVTHVQQHASTLEQAIFIIKEYLAHSFSIIGLEDSVRSDRYFLRLFPTVEHPALIGHLMSAVQLFIYRELKLILPNLDPIQGITVALDISPLLQRMYGPLVKSGTDFEFELTAESRSMSVHRNGFGDLSSVAPKFIDLLNKELPNYGPFAKRVRRLILSLCDPETPAIDEVAVHFPMSLRSFQRRLSQEGTNFKDIRDGIRQELSAFFERDIHMQTKEVAYILGYSESSAYIHARQRWKKQAGTTV